MADERGWPEGAPPTVGLKFVHARMIDAATNEPLRARVTAVRQGTVYFRGLDGKGSWSKPVDRFHQAVGEVITDVQG